MSDRLAPEFAAAVFPAGVFSADLEDRGQAIALRAAERDIVLSSGEKRIRDFTLGRDCAHRALRRLGVRANAILRHGDGAPSWPAEVVGSITHTGGYAAAAVASAARFAGVGVDAERVETLAAAVERRLFLPEELAGLEGLAAGARAVAAMTLFSAKEACFKACTRETAPRRFHDIRIRLGDGEFAVSIGPLQATGKAIAVAGLVVTGVAIPAT